VVAPGPLAQDEAVGAGLVEGVVGPLRDQVQPVRHLGVGDLLDLTASHLRLSDMFTCITTQTGQTANRLSQKARRTGQPDVPVVRFIAHHHIGAEAEPGQEVAVRITVPDEAVHDPNVGRTRVEVQPDTERQPVTMLAVQLHDRPHRPVLLDGDRLHRRGRLLPVATQVLVRCVLPQTD
jgi:hypothetical protein